MIDIQPIILKGASVQLEPLSILHHDELFVAAQDETIWTYNTSKPMGSQFQKWFDKALHGKQQLTFVVRQRSDQKVLGSTRFYDINAAHHRVALGYTWYIPDVWGTQVNPECKLLLLTHVFENLNFNRVEFFTDSRNARSRAAIQKLGAKEEGILRSHMIIDNGYIRDTVVFSVIKSEWPVVRAGLEARIRPE